MQNALQLFTRPAILLFVGALLCTAPSGRPLTATFRLGGQDFSGTTIYADYRPEAKTGHYDALAGNALFWDKMIIIDFKYKRFGVK